MIRMIIASSENHCIGKAGKLPFKLQADMQNFKHITQGNVCIMGRKTYESIGKALKNRINIIVSHKHQYLLHVEGDEWYTNNPKRWLPTWSSNHDISIIGGAEIYALLAHWVQQIVWTRVQAHIEGDTFFEPDTTGFYLKSEQAYPQDENNQYPFVIQTWERIKGGQNG